MKQVAEEIYNNNNCDYSYFPVNTLYVEVMTDRHFKLQELSPHDPTTTICYCFLCWMAVEKNHSGGKEWSVYLIDETLDTIASAPAVKVFTSLLSSVRSFIVTEDTRPPSIHSPFVYVRTRNVEELLAIFSIIIHCNRRTC